MYNEFVPGASSNNNQGGFSYRLHGALEIPIASLPFMVEVDYRQWNWGHNCGGSGDPECLVTTIGGLGTSSVPTFTGRDYDFDARLGIRVLQAAHLHRRRVHVARKQLRLSEGEPGPASDSRSYPTSITSFSWYGHAIYFFGVNGNYQSTPLACGTPTAATGCTYNVGYNILKYDIGVTYTFQRFPLFLEAGFMGDRGYNSNAAPIGFSESGPYAGIGLKI